MGNPSAGIILILGASALIAVGFTGKGKQIINILMSGAGSTVNDKGGDDSIIAEKTVPKQSGGYEHPADAPSLAGFAGEKAAKAVLL